MKIIPKLSFAIFTMAISLQLLAQDSKVEKGTPLPAYHSPKKGSEEQKRAKEFCDKHVKLIKIVGEGPSSNRVLHFYYPTYRWNTDGFYTTMENLIADYEFRVGVAADQFLKKKYDTVYSRIGDGGRNFIKSGNPILRKIYERYAPLHQLWRLECFKPWAPFWSKSTCGSFLANTLRKHPEFGREERGARRFYRWGVMGAGATGKLACSKISVSKYMVFTDPPHPKNIANIWAWVHEGTHCNEVLTHGGTGKAMREGSVERDNGQATQEPTAANWGAWINHIGAAKGLHETERTRKSDYIATIHSHVSKYERRGFQDTNKDNACISTSRGEQMIHKYYKNGAIKPLDSYTPNESPLMNPVKLTVKTISTSIFQIRWYVNGTELIDKRGLETLDIKSLDLAVGQYRITAEVYDSCIDYAFTGDVKMDLVRYGLEKMAQNVGWTVKNTRKGTNKYQSNATLLNDKGAFATSNFNTPLSKKKVVLPYVTTHRTLAARENLAIAGLHSEGDYTVSGNGKLNFIDSKFSALPNTSTHLNNDCKFLSDVIKTGLGEIALGGSNTLSSKNIDVKEGTLIATGPKSFGENTSLTIRRGAEVKLNAGVSLGDTTMEGFSALWSACKAGETASVKNLKVIRIGNDTVGEQFHGYLKIGGEGTFVLKGNTKLNNSVLIFTGDSIYKWKSDKLVSSGPHWIRGFGKNAVFEIRDQITGLGSLSFIHKGQTRVLGNISLSGDYADMSDPGAYNGIISVLYGTRLTVEGAVKVPKIDVGHFSTFEYNGSSPMMSNFALPNRSRKSSSTIPGLFGRLCGTGDIGTKVTLLKDAKFSPGAYGKAGSQHYRAGLLVDNVATYEWHLANARAPMDSQGTPTGWDCIEVTGTLNLNVTTKAAVPNTKKKKRRRKKAPSIVEATLLTIKVLDFGKKLSEIKSNPKIKQSFLIAKADSILGFSPDKFLIDDDSTLEKLTKKQSRKRRSKKKKSKKNNNSSELAKDKGKWSVKINNANTELYLVYEKCTAAERKIFEEQNAAKRKLAHPSMWNPAAIAKAKKKAKKK